VSRRRVAITHPVDPINNTESAPIAQNPPGVYASAGWMGWGDWLGTANIHKREWSEFQKARRFTRSLELRSSAEWQRWIKEELNGKPRRPSDIPKAPHAAYAEEGWKSWGDWLGSGRTIGGWRDFPAARRYVRSLQLRSQTEWRQWIRGELRSRPKRPVDIPRTPWLVYEGRGWAGIRDWLGTAPRSSRGKTRGS
jgi:hypothetical protein